MSKDKANATSLGRNDITLDMFGWKQAGEQFKLLNEFEVKQGKMSQSAPILAYKWYNAGHIDYYVARQVGKSVIALGDLNDQRNYAWINRRRNLPGDIKEAYYISPSRDYKSPYEICAELFKTIEPIDTMRIVRAGKVVENMLVFRLRN